MRHIENPGINIWRCSEYVSVSITAQYSTVICTVILCCAKQQTHSEFWHIQYSVFFFSGIFWHIKSYSTLLRHIRAYSDIIKPYSHLFRHIHHAVYQSHIRSLIILWAYLKPCETLIRHFQNPATEHYSAMFRHIQNLAQRLHMQKPGIL